MLSEMNCVGTAGERQIEAVVHHEAGTAGASHLTDFACPLERLGIGCVLVGYLGMPRRYHFYPPEFQIYNVLSTGGAMVLGIGYLLPVLYLTYSLFKGKKATANPWNAKGLEWETSSPPPTFNFEGTPVVTEPAYAYAPETEGEAVVH